MLYYNLVNVVLVYYNVVILASGTKLLGKPAVCQGIGQQNQVLGSPLALRIHLDTDIHLI